VSRKKGKPYTPTERLARIKAIIEAAHRRGVVTWGDVALIYKLAGGRPA